MHPSKRFSTRSTATSCWLSASNTCQSPTQKSNWWCCGVSHGAAAVECAGVAGPSGNAATGMLNAVSASAARVNCRIVAVRRQGESSRTSRSFVAERWYATVFNTQRACNRRRRVLPMSAASLSGAPRWNFVPMAAELLANHVHQQRTRPKAARMVAKSATAAAERRKLIVGGISCRTW